MTFAPPSTRLNQSRRSRSVATASMSSNVISFEQARQRRELGIEPKIKSTKIQPPKTVESDEVEVLSPKKFEPFWLQSITTIQQLSSIVTGVIVGITLSTYGITVYRESIWTQEYQTLENLRTEEQQLRTANEILKHELAKEAVQPDIGLVEKQPQDMIFLRPAPSRPEIPPSQVPALEVDSGRQSRVVKPLGY